jgi:DNA-binding NarL/FixJ family response regulator
MKLIVTGRMDRPRILIADDHTLVAEAFKTLLEPDYQVIKLVADDRSLLVASKELKLDVVLLDPEHASGERP